MRQLGCATASAGETAAIAIEGPEAAAMLAKIGAPAPEKDLDHAEWNSAFVIRTSYTGGSGFVIVSSSAQRQPLVDALESAGAIGATPDAFRMVRIENGRPRYGDDIKTARQALAALR